MENQKLMKNRMMLTTLSILSLGLRLKPKYDWENITKKKYCRLPSSSSGQRYIKKLKGLKKIEIRYWNNKLNPKRRSAKPPSTKIRLKVMKFQQAGKNVSPAPSRERKVG